MRERDSPRSLKCNWSALRTPPQRPQTGPLHHCSSCVPLPSSAPGRSRIVRPEVAPSRTALTTTTKPRESMRDRMSISRPHLRPRVAHLHLVERVGHFSAGRCSKHLEAGSDNQKYIADNNTQQCCASSSSHNAVLTTPCSLRPARCIRSRLCKSMASPIRCVLHHSSSPHRRPLLRRERS